MTRDSLEYSILTTNDLKSSQPGRAPWFGLALAGVTGGLAVALSVIAAPFVAPAFRKVCLPYVPASSQQVRNVLLALGKSSRTKSLVDLGSGDGRLVIAAAAEKQVPKCTGVELNPWLVAYSRFQAWQQNVAPTTSFLRADLFSLNLGRYDNVVIFGVQEMMAGLEEKLSRELGAESCVIACRFPLPNWTPAATFGSGIDTVWFYRHPTLQSSGDCPHSAL